MGFGSCIVSIFPCPVPALGLGRPFFMLFCRANPNLMELSEQIHRVVEAEVDVDDDVDKQVLIQIYSNTVSLHPRHRL